METGFLLRGFIIGFSIAAPVGPIGVLCIRRTLSEGRASGFVSGLGAATADALYGCVAAFGLTAVSSFLVGQQLWLRLVGGVFLCFLGVKTFFARPADDSTAARSNSLASAYASTLLLTLTNPMTILSFAAVFAGLGLGGPTGDYVAATVMVLGVLLGSALWWWWLSFSVGLFRGRLDTRCLKWVNRISGSVIGGFGVLALLSFSATHSSED